MFAIPFKTKKNNPNTSILNTIEKIKNGDDTLRNDIINQYKPFILKTLSRITGRYIDIRNSDEFSIGLMAFNEAIDSFKLEEKTNFLTFCENVIKRRCIDLFRKKQKNSTEYPYSYFENEENPDFHEKYSVEDSSKPYENIEIKDQLAFFEKRLNEFGITLDDLVLNSPKHFDSKQLCVSIAKLITDNEDLYEKLNRKKTVPMVDLMKIANVSQRTVERNRKFIISVCLIIKSDLDILKGYIKNTEERGK